MTLVLTIYLLLITATVFMVFYSSIHFSVKGTALSLAVLLGVVTHGHYTEQLGKPVQGYPPVEFVYVHHNVDGDNINLWIWTEDRGNRLYVMPYSQETAEELEKAKAKTEGGQAVAGEFIEQEDGREGHPGLELDDYQPAVETERK